MSLSQLQGRLSTENLLFTVLIELTYQCNLNCFFCYNDLSLKGEPLKTEEYFRFFADLQQLQAMTLVFSGGEPLVHPDFLALGRRARELGFIIRIKSNGHALNKRMAQKIRREVDPYVIEMSLHGARAETHDRQTRIPGSFDRLLIHLPQLLDLGFRLQLNSTLTAWNEHEVEDMFALADRLGIRLQIQSDVTPRDNGDQTPLEIRASDAGTRQLLRLQMERAKAAAKSKAVAIRPNHAPVSNLQAIQKASSQKVEKSCGAGSSGLAIDPFGNVYPCVQWRRPIANLRERSIINIWNHSNGLKSVRQSAKEAYQVIQEQGPTGTNMGFCMGLANQYTGNPTEVYDAALRRMNLRNAVEGEKKGGLLPIID